MGIQFHDGTHKLFQTYSGGSAWNDNGLLLDPPQVLKTLNTEAKMTNLLASLGNDLMTPMVHDFAKLLASKELNVWVVKGLHQPGQGFVLTPHITLGWDGYLWHIEFINDSKKGLVGYAVTKGEQASDEDADGFQKVTGKKKRK